MAADSRDPYAGPTDSERRRQGRRFLAVGSAIVVGLIVAMLLLSFLAQVL